MAVYREGAFPFNWFSSSTPVFDTATPLGKGSSAPQVTAAVAQDSHTVRVAFSEEMLHVNPANTDDSLNPTNYIFTSGTGAPVSASSVALFQASPTIVDITLGSEMTNGATYNVQVQRVKNLRGQPIDPDYDNQDFTGIGIAPRVLSASAPSSVTIRVVFNEAMLNTAQLRDPSRYSFSGPTAIAASTVTIINSTTVEVGITGEMRTGGAYDVIVGPPYTGIEDAGWNELDPAHHTASFTGVGIAPQLSNVIGVDPTTLDVDFSENVQQTAAETPGNYAITVIGGPGTVAVITATKITATRVRLVTATQGIGVHYLMTVTNVPDLAGNPIDPLHNTDDFYGVGMTPPSVIVHPAHGTVDMPVRNLISVHMYDSSLGLAGINQSKCWVRVRYQLDDGTNVDLYAVENGAIANGFVGSISGDPLSADGVTFSFKPERNWPDLKPISLWAYAEDMEGAGATASPSPTIITTAVSECFEDTEQDALPIETTLMSRMAPPNIDQLRRLLLGVCSKSSDQRIQARTLLYLATLTELKTLVASGFNYDWVNVKLCDRTPILTIHALLRRHHKVFAAAIQELAVTKEARELLDKNRQSNSSIYVVNSAAVVVVLAALLGA